MLLSLAPMAQERFVEHRVKWFETLSSISEKYGVSAESILRCNGIGEEDVKARAVLRIPLSPAADSQTDEVPAMEEIAGESLEVPLEEETENTIFDDSNPLKVSIVLPFGAGGDNPSVNYFDFYSGALMALRNAQNAGHCVSLSIYDLCSASFDDLCLDESFAASNLIIGPPHASELEPFAAYALQHNIALVSPMDPGAERLLEGNPYMFQIPASTHTQLANTVDLIQDEPDGQVLVFYDSSMREEALVNRITSALDSAETTYRLMGYGLLKGRNLSENLQRELDPDKKYKVVVASQDDAFAPDIVRNMRVLKLLGVDVELFCSNRVRNFESIDSDSFYELSTHVAAPYYIDYTCGEAKDFVSKYRALFNAEPTPYSFQGFDIVSYFATMMCTVGSSFVQSADLHPMDMLQCSIRLGRDDKNNGWRNLATRNIVYNEDLSISIEQQDQD